MKSNSENKIFEYAKYFLLVPVIVMMLAVIVFVLFSYNKSIDFKDSYGFTVSYKKDMSPSEYLTAVNLIENNLYDKFGNKISIETNKVNDEIEVGSFVKVYVNSEIKDFEKELNSVQDEIKTELNTLLNNGHVIISDVQEFSGLNYSKDLLWSGVALLVVMALAFVYFLVRFEIKTALSSLTIIPFVVLLLSSITILFRLPATTLFTTPIVVSSLLAYIVYMILSEKVRENLRNEKYDSLTNKQLYITSLNASKKSIGLLVLGATIIYIMTLFFFSMKTFVLAISGILGLVIAVYVSTIITGILWTKLYRRDKDNRLKELKDNEAKSKKEGKKKKTKEEKEKILV